MQSPRRAVTTLDEPSNTQAVLGVLIPAAIGIIVVATVGFAAVAAAPAAGTAAAALVPMVTNAFVAGGVAATSAALTVIGLGVSLKKEFVDAAKRALNQVEVTGHFAKRALNQVEVTGHFANGDWFHVRGGIKKDAPYSAWQPMRFER